jgi:hypothetical protein
MTTVHGNLLHACWTPEYVLAHCERYRIETEGGHLGYVDQVVLAPNGREAARLVVRTAEGDRIAVAVAEVLELHPSGERIVVRAPRRPSTVESGLRRAGSRPDDDALLPPPRPLARRRRRQPARHPG